MPAQQRFPTRYPGVYYIEGRQIGTGKPERIYYLTYRRDGRQVHEKAGRQFQDDMTPARAAHLRTLRINGGEPPNKVRREADKAAKEAEAGRWTIQKLADEYFAQRPAGHARVVDRNRYDLHLKAELGPKEPAEIDPLSVDRLRKRLEKSKSKQTVKHVLNLLTWIVNFGRKRSLCPGFGFHVSKPEVHNIKTEFLTDRQLQNLLAVLDRSANIQVANMLRLALFTGMRRGELLKLTWQDVDFERGFITLRNPKGGKPQTIPLNESARQVLEQHPRLAGTPLVFPGAGGKRRAGVDAALRKIRKAADLPEDFRMLHGLRHQFASMLASSGAVDMYVLQKLLTHKSPQMTARYAHLRDEALRKASNLAGEIVNQAMASAAAKADKAGSA